MEELQSATTLVATALLDIELGLEKNPGISLSTGVSSRAPGGDEPALERRRETGKPTTGASSISTKKGVAP
jgi:hypothetical protein